jgi:hypothetical protein
MSKSLDQFADFCGNARLFRHFSKPGSPKPPVSARASEATLFVPVSSVARTTEATFVVRIHDGTAEWVNVQTGEVDGKVIEVFGDLHSGDEVASRGTDELRPGTRVSAKLAPPDLQSSPK